MKKTFLSAFLLIALGGTAAFGLIRSNACNGSCAHKPGSVCTSKAMKATAAINKNACQANAGTTCPDRPGCICSH